MNIFLLDKQQNIIKLLPQEAIIEAKLEEGINTAAKLNLSVDYTHKIDNSIFYVCVPTERDDDSYLMLKIISETISNTQVDYVCLENAYDELAKYAYVQDLRPNNQTAAALVALVTKNTRWTVGVSDGENTADMSFYYQTVLECLQDIVKQFNVELQFNVYIDSTTNKINRRQINVYTQMGQRTGKRFEYGSNLLSIKREESSDTIFTAIVGRGAGLENTDNQGNETGGYTRRITFADVEWSKAKGDPLDKPKGQEWLEDPDATAKYGFSDGKPRIGLQVFEDIKDQNQLLWATYQALQQAKIPKVQFSASVLDVGDLGLGDTVAIIRHDLGFEYFTRVFKVTRDLLDKNNNTVELGDNLAEESSITAQISKLEQATVKNSQHIGIVMNAANGKNKVFYTTELPETADKGDICYLDLGNGNTDEYIWNKGWQKVISTTDIDQINNEIKANAANTQQAINTANSAVNKAEAQSQKFQNDISKINNDVADTKNALDNTVSNLKQAQTQLSSVARQAQNNQSNIVSIDKSVNSLTTTVAGVNGSVSELKQKADSLNSSITNNKNDISQLKQTANEVKVDITDNKNSIADLTGTSNRLESTISNLTVGSGGNLLPDTQTMGTWEQASDGSLEDATQDNTITNAYHEWGEPNNAWIKSPQDKPVRLVANQQYTFSAKLWDYEQDNNEHTHDVYLKFTDGQQEQSFLLTNKTTNKPITYHVTFTVKQTGNYYGFCIIDTNFINGSLWTAEYMLQAGNTALAYSPSLTTSGDFSQLTQTVNSINSVVNDNKGNISKMQQTVNGIQSTVTDKINGVQAQQTLLSNQYSSVIKTIQNPNVVPNSQFLHTSNETQGWSMHADNGISVGWSNDSNGNPSIWIDGSQATAVNDGTANWMSSQIPVPQGAKVFSTACQFLLTNTGSIQVGVQMRGDNFDDWKGACYFNYDINKLGKWQYLIMNNLSIPDGTTQICFIFQSNAATLDETKRINAAVAEPQIVFSDKVGMYVASDVTQSEIVQLRNDINLRVKTGDVINQINIDTSGILISGQKVHITGQTTIDDAVIKDAMIGNISADKITAGTLNAANLNVINLNGNSIVANSITADKLASNSILVGLNNGLNNLQISPDNITIHKNGKQVLCLDQAGMRVTDPGTGEEMGLIATTEEDGNPYNNGLMFGLDHPGNFMCWSVLNEKGDHYMPVLAYSRDGQMFHGQCGIVTQAPININNDIWLGTGTAIHIFEYGSRIALEAMNVSGNAGFYIGNDSAGITFCDNGKVFIQSYGTSYDFNDWVVNK